MRSKLVKYKIVGIYQGNREELDEADTEVEAKYLVSEYRMAFGAGWSISIVPPKKKKVGPPNKEFPYKETEYARLLIRKAELMVNPEEPIEVEE